MSDINYCSAQPAVGKKEVSWGVRELHKCLIRKKMEWGQKSQIGSQTPSESEIVTWAAKELA